MNSIRHMSPLLTVKDIQYTIRERVLVRATNLKKDVCVGVTAQRLPFMPSAVRSKGPFTNYPWQMPRSPCWEVS